MAFLASVVLAAGLALQVAASGGENGRALVPGAPSCNAGDGAGAGTCAGLIDIRWINVASQTQRAANMRSMLGSILRDSRARRMVRTSERFEGVAASCPCTDAPCPERACSVSDRCVLSNTTIRTLETNKTRNEHYGNSRPGRIGCWCSHYSALHAYAHDSSAAPLLLLLEDDVVLDADGRHPKYEEAVNNVKVWGRGEDASFFEMLPAWLSQLPPEWDVLRFSTFTTFCLQDLLRGPSPIFHAVRHAQPCDGANS
eukprot:34581-Prymnesium_polylepis.1